MKVRRSKFIFVPFGAAIAMLLMAATAYACTNFNGEFIVTGNATGSTTVYETGTDTGGFGMAQTLHGTCCAKASHLNSTGTMTLQAAADRTNSSNHLAAGSYDINFIGGNAYTSFGANWSLDCMDGTTGISVLASNVTVSSTGTWGPATYSVPTGQSANTGTNESAACISDNNADSGNEVPITLL